MLAKIRAVIQVSYDLYVPRGETHEPSVRKFNGTRNLVRASYYMRQISGVSRHSRATSLVMLGIALPKKSAFESIQVDFTADS